MENRPWPEVCVIFKTIFSGVISIVVSDLFRNMNIRKVFSKFVVKTRIRVVEMETLLSWSRLLAYGNAIIKKDRF